MIPDNRTFCEGEAAIDKTVASAAGAVADVFDGSSFDELEPMTGVPLFRATAPVIS